jgi:hypothetical protein
MAHIRRVHADNYGVYGARKVCTATPSTGWSTAPTPGAKPGSSPGGPGQGASRGRATWRGPVMTYGEILEVTVHIAARPEIVFRISPTRTGTCYGWATA